jgi:hypothetical protein
MGKELVFSAVVGMFVVALIGLGLASQSLFNQVELEFDPPLTTVDRKDIYTSRPALQVTHTPIVSLSPKDTPSPHLATQFDTFKPVATNPPSIPPTPKTTSRPSIAVVLPDTPTPPKEEKELCIPQVCFEKTRFHWHSQFTLLASYPGSGNTWVRSVCTLKTVFVPN